MKIFNLFKNYSFFNSRNFIPYGKQNINNSDVKAIVKVLRSDYLTQGPLVEDFEYEISKKVNSDYSIAVNSATSALHIACLSLGLKKGDYLWTSSITFVASANCGLYCGAKVDFVDIDPNSALISIKLLKEKLEKAKLEKKLPKIIIPVHLAGSSCDMKEIFNLSKIYGFSIIEDASHAIGGSYENEPIGSCRYSDITIFSFHPVKIITTAEGGVAVTNNRELAQKMSDLRSHCIIRDAVRFLEKTTPLWRYEMQDLGFNYRMNEIQAALGLSQLKRLDNIVASRNLIYKKYKKLLCNVPLKLIDIPNNVYSSIHLVIVKLDNIDKYEYIFNEMRSKGIGVQLHYWPVHLQPYYKNLGFKKGDFRYSEDYAKRSFSLPVYPELTNSNINRICQELIKLIN